ncbi:YlbF family regulator [Staphylococcus capitis]|uniref:YlbF family regulator n=1 Tax=Staphylococcus capitis TaxID=29388 RepID=A0A7Z7YXD0_STACP|nr:MULTISPECIES: YlbF family regulator [Staphylococcus]MBC3079722.1 YlbF family regulator [Staphylococcus capitis]MBC8781233.1 YlbF family regulator [Staphylococcus capitis]MBE7321317.1 YlbF family regulator [Staphylococcus capitis]MBU5290620.1 YlbF family regulator [Staphylococcus capitis]MCC3689579.1 YlbF family regulator [Staphylococcus capitis]
MITEETLSILDEIENLSDMIVQSDVYQTYQYAKDNLENDDEAHLLYQAFLKSKDQYDDVMRFGKYHPDYKRIMMETRQRKRAYEMLPVVMEYKTKEVALQDLIDEVLTKIAFAVSENVKIEAGNPFFQTGHNGCATGGSCNCSL